MVRKLIFVVVLMSLVWGGCYRCHKAHNYRQQQATHKYVPSLKAGSYYVYRNIADPTDQDTLYVVQNSDSMLFHFAEKQCDGDYFEKQLVAMVFAGDRDTVSQEIHSGTGEDDYSMRGMYKGTRVFSYYAVDGAGKILVPYSDTLHQLSSYTVAGNTYSDVIRVISPAYTVHSPVQFYYAAGIGVIQFDTYDQENSAIANTYELVSYSFK